MSKWVKFEELLGKILTKIEVSPDKDEMFFYTNEGNTYRMFHCQDCCECVEIDDIVGDLNDLIGYPLEMAEESTNSENPKSDWEESFTWTFYKLATVKGYVNIKWYGSSNGYYSESVEIELLEEGEN
jgi:hypothetical protein